MAARFISATSSSVFTSGNSEDRSPAANPSSLSASAFSGPTQEGAKVRNLTVTGEVSPSGSQDQVGGIVGVNYGSIENCKFTGNVVGDTDVGGIAGVNAESGEIRRCESSGNVIGNHSAGGIVGNNHGILNNCSNNGNINTYSTEVTYDLEDITMDNLEQINSTSNVAAHTDTGGIAGISDGKIYYCSNSGAIGYQHVGYNTGGIVGRLHQGYLQNCTNTGYVQGRKDVGGIVGEIRNLLGGEIYKPTEWIGRFRQTEGELRVQIYEDKGQGFSEENSYFPENVYAEEKQAEFTVNFDGNVHYLRLDPAMCACVCKIRELTMNGQPVPVQDKKIVTTNGKILKSADGAEHPSVVFPTEDPNLTIRVDALDRKAENILTVKMEIVQIPPAVASDMAGAVKKFF